jgi:hypothetical protein
MDIVDQAESKVQPGGTELVAKGETKLAMQQISDILPVPGAELAGSLPPELQPTPVLPRRRRRGCQGAAGS